MDAAPPRSIVRCQPPMGGPPVTRDERLVLSRGATARDLRTGTCLSTVLPHPAESPPESCPRTPAASPDAPPPPPRRRSKCRRGCLLPLPIGGPSRWTLHL